MIDFNKPVQTGDGQPVEIITTSGRGNYPVKGYIGEEESVRGWTLDGTYVMGFVTPRYDLENAPQYWIKEKEAFAQGKTIQFRSKQFPEWQDNAIPLWFSPNTDGEPEYRIKPESIPLTKDDIKAGDIFLRKDGYEFQWTARSVNAIMLGSFWRDYKELKEKGWKIKSLDSDWRPCEKEASGE